LLICGNQIKSSKFVQIPLLGWEKTRQENSSLGFMSMQEKVSHIPPILAAFQAWTNPEVVGN
jgi:hypothetical protein